MYKNFQFSPKIETYLIEKFKENSLLWNKNDKFYKIRSRRTAAYENIFIQAQKQFPQITNFLNADLIRNKLMKAYYCSLKSKSCTHEISDEFKPKWEHFDKFNFLESNEIDPLLDTPVTNRNEIPCLTNPNIISFDNAIDFIEETFDSSDNESEEIEKLNSPETKRRKIECENTSSTSVIERSISNLMNTINQSIQTTVLPKSFQDFFINEDAPYCMYLAQQLQQMDTNTKDNFIFKVNNLLENCKQNRIKDEF